MIGWLMLLGAAGIPLTLLWDFSWEATIGVDPLLSPPHAANFAAVALLAGCAAAALVQETRAGSGAVALGRVRASLGAFIVVWGALAFVTAFLFDRWWQAGYGLAAGIWHPPQLAKALAYFALACGVWLYWLPRQAQRAGALGFALAGGVVLALVMTVTLASSFANLQRSASFYLIACGTYPLVLVALARAGRLRFAATLAGLAAMALVGVLVWTLPLVRGAPEVGPIYNPRDTLLPPPFPLLLALPALALDLLLRVFPGRSGRGQAWLRALEAGLAFGAVFGAAQWWFARFLLSPAADHWFFAGGGRHWPFFLRIDPTARTAFWPGDELGLASAALALALAIAAAQLGLWLGAAMKRARA